MNEKAVLAARALRFGFGRTADFLGPLDIELAPGKFWGIIGPNGAGKSTLLRLLAGLLAPRAGSLTLSGRDLGDIPAAERARRVAYLPQSLPADLPLSAGQVVLMGRYPHRRFGLFEDAADERIADECMRTTETLGFKHRSMGTLSGGEAQRVHLAAALAQQPAILLLDEPTAALDLYHQLSVLQTVKRLAAVDQLLVVAAMHDLNLAARFCDRLLLLDRGQCIASGHVSSVLEPGMLEGVYGVRITKAEINGQTCLLPGERTGDRESRSDAGGEVRP